MSDGKLCRICVRKDVKMYEHNRYQLMLHYKEVTGSKISSRDCLPKWFCFECAALLHKFHEFKKKCTHGQKVLKKLLEKRCASKDNMTRKNRITSSEPYLQILSTFRNKHVKTYTVQHTDVNSITKTHSKKKCNNFTEVFVDVKSDVEIDIDNPKHSTEKEIIKVTDIENSAEAKEPQLFDDNFDNDMYNDDSNDSIPFVFNNKDRESNIDETGHSKRTSNVELRINDVDNSHTEEQTDYKEKISHDIERTDSVTERTDNDNKSPTSVIKRTQKNYEAVEPNLDNKFQRSVKKKFLDENHWTKITLSDEEATKRFQAKALEQKYLKAIFKCADCFRTFSQEDMMKRHIKLRHCESLGPNECRHCRMRFKWKSRLQKHLKEHYTIYKCLRCELSFPVEISAFQHDYSHNGVTWTCAHCGQGFRHSSTYYTHLRKHKSKHVCTLCGVSFVSEFGLFMHKRVKHVISDDSKEECSNTYCKVCDIKFDTLKGYEEHFAESALHATEFLEGATCLPLKTRCTKKRVPRISTNCTTCGKTFSTYAAFSKHHLSVHPGVALPKSRTDKQDGQRQICEVCGVTLASAWSLINHLNTHSRDKRYTCKTCGMQLSSRSVLQRHQLTHTNEKSFICDMCDKRFSHRAGLGLHLRTHDKNHSPNRNKKKKSDPQNVLDYFKNFGTLSNNYR